MKTEEYLLKRDFVEGSHNIKLTRFIVQLNCFLGDSIKDFSVDTKIMKNTIYVTARRY